MTDHDGRLLVRHSFSTCFFDCVSLTTYPARGSDGTATALLACEIQRWDNYNLYILYIVHEDMLLIICVDVVNAAIEFLDE